MSAPTTSEAKPPRDKLQKAAARNTAKPKGPLDLLWQFCTSLKVTVTLLGLSVLLVFFGTLAQVDQGLWKAQHIWFESFFVIGEKLRLFGITFWVPFFPGGYLIGHVLLINLISAFIKRFQWRWDKIGIHLTHAGVILLLLGELLRLEFSRESHLRLKEGETKNYSEAHRADELVFIRDLDEKRDQVISVPSSIVAKGGTISHPQLPFTARTVEYGINSEIRRRGPAVDGPSKANQGVGTQLTIEPRPEVKDMDSRNMPYAFVELLHNGKPLGTWLVTPWLSFLDVPHQDVEVEGQQYRIAFRPERYYKPYSITLLSTTHEIYRGTDIPKNFKSRVKVANPEKSETREVDIYMNHPMRYDGLTFYQYQMGRDELDSSRGTSTLQVVRNPSWLAPYAGCYVVAVGMYMQFRSHFVKFLRKRRGAAAGKTGALGKFAAISLEVLVLGYMVYKFTANLFGYA